MAKLPQWKKGEADRIVSMSFGIMRLSIGFVFLASLLFRSVSLFMECWKLRGKCISSSAQSVSVPETPSCSLESLLHLRVAPGTVSLVAEYDSARLAVRNCSHDGYWRMWKQSPRKKIYHARSIRRHCPSTTPTLNWQRLNLTSC